MSDAPPETGERRLKYPPRTGAQKAWGTEPVTSPNHTPQISAPPDLHLTREERAYILETARKCGATNALVRRAPTEEDELDVEYTKPLARRRPFERIRRITGYLVGTLERFNDAKKAEEHDRVKHGLDEAAPEGGAR